MGSTSEVIRLESVRISYPHIYTPSAFEEGDPKKFSAKFLLDPSDPNHAAKIKEIKLEAAKLMREEFGPDFKAAGLKGVCFADGNTRVDDQGDVKEGYADMWVIGASEFTRTAVANRTGDPVVEGEPQAPYGGCYVNATITLWTQNNKWGKRINANLRGTQFVKDGDAFGRAPISAEDEFEALEDNTPADASMEVGDDDPFA